ncbi:MAG: FeoB-associated Cys-rich membrane protein [Agathobacter sp.]|nr:FeoB-associated Cys-rich membrane protein [Agathobacter sp.]
MNNLIIIGTIIVLVGTAVIYIRKEKKKGKRCIGCPAAGSCSGNVCANGCKK